MACVSRPDLSLWRGGSCLRLDPLLNRILVLRGGAIGDFVLTLPALKALREHFPRSALEIVGQKQIVTLAERRFYAEATRSLDDPLLAPFFARGSDLAPDWVRYFASFDLIISYLFDPEGILADNLRRAGAQHLVTGSPKLSGRMHAARELAQPLFDLGVPFHDPAAKLYLSDNDRAVARALLRPARRPFVAIHPGSGSTTKNWPADRWLAFARVVLASSTATLIIVGGEADRRQVQLLRAELPPQRATVAEDLPLPHLAAVIADCDLFMGHDSGVSHLAAATDTKCLLLFGPTDPAIWAPANENAHVLRAPGGEMAMLRLEEVERAAQELMRIGIST